MFSSQELSRTSSAFMSRVYFWMMLGLATSGLVAFAFASSPSALAPIYTNKLIWFGLIIVQLGAVFTLSAMINRMSYFVTTMVYLGYAALTGVTFSVIFLAFTSQSIASAFFITAFAFVGLSVFAMVTKRDLTGLGTFCMTGLFGLIGFMIIAMIFPSIMSNAMSMTINILAIMIFAGLTAYDTQRIKGFNMMYGASSGDMAKKAAISGALMLYLDFINLFLNILNLMGDRR